MTEEPASGAGGSFPGLPIIIGVEGSVEFGESDWQPLCEFLKGELASRRQTYPHSSIFLLPRTTRALQSILSAAAAKSEIRVLAQGEMVPGYGLLRDFDLGSGECHVLIRVLADGDGDPPRDTTTGVSLEASCDVELIEVRLSLDRHGLTVSRGRLTGTEADPDDEPNDTTLRRTDTFNADTQTFANRAGDPELIPSNLGTSIESCSHLQRLFVIADAMSNAYQARVARTIQVIFALATFAAVLYGLFLIYGGGNPSLQGYLLAPYLALLVLAYIAYFLAKRADLHDRFVEYRALAEGARVQLYWLACGVESIVTDSYFAARAVDLQWIRVALRLATPAPPKERSAADPQRAAAALRYWIRREKAYYTRSAARSKRAQRWSGILVRVLFIGGGCATLLVLLQFQLPLAPFLKRIGLASFLCPSLAAAIVALVTKLGVTYRAEHHTRMLTLYTQAERRLERWGPERAMSLAVALGEAALRESEEWTVFRRERRIDEPASPFRRPW